MQKELSTFVMRGLVVFLFLELVTLPLRQPIVEVLEKLLPEGYVGLWECTALDEVFLYVSFVLAYPSPKSKLPFLLAGVIVIEAFNILRIAISIFAGNPLLHDVLFRWGGFVVVMTLFFIAFSRLSSRQAP